MDVVAGLLTSKAEDERKLAEARGGTSSDDGGFLARQLRRAGLSKAQALSSLASLADWITDFQYYFEVRSWTEGRYAPSDTDIVDCADFLMSEGRFVNGILDKVKANLMRPSRTNLRSIESMMSSSLDTSFSDSSSI